jgi:hypothetical protein
MVSCANRFNAVQYITTMPVTHPLRRSAVYLLRDLVRSSNIFPVQMRLQGVQIDEAIHETPGNSHIRDGIWEDKAVVVKEIRIVDRSVRHIHSLGYDLLHITMQVVIREAITWAALKHPNVLQLFGVVYHHRSNDTPMLVSPTMVHGHVGDYVKTEHYKHSKSHKTLVSVHIHESQPCCMMIP